jgi:Major Facilitator Superfamily
MTAYARFVAASGVTNLADGIATLAWAWAATLLTRDPFLVALVAIALRLPWAILAIPAGVVTDRVDRRRLILAMDILRGLAFAAAALALAAASPLPPAGDGLAAPGLYAALVLAALTVGGAEVFRDNAAQTMLPALVPREALERANGRMWSVELVGNALLGPALGAFLIGAAVALPFSVNAGLYGLAVLLVAGVAGTFRTPPAPRNLRAEVAEGARFLWQVPLLRTLAAVTGGWNLLHQMVVIALVLHVQENLGLSAQAYGLILAAGAVGGIAGSLAAEAVIRRLGPGRTAQWMLATSAPAFAAVALAPGPVALALVLALFEASGLIWNVVSVSWRQRRIPDALMGRVNSIYRLLAWGMMPLGLFLSGALTGAAEGAVARGTALTLPFWVAAAGALALTAAAWRPLGRGFAASD